MQEVPLIQQKVCQGGIQYEVCKQGIAYLRTLKNKKLRIIFNITHDKMSLNYFNSMLFSIGKTPQVKGEARENVCLTISKYVKDLEGERGIIILNAYQKDNCQPLMALMGYLATSVFVYHHQNRQLSQNSPLTAFLSKLKNLLSETTIENLTKQMTYKKGYSKTPHFLCLLPQKYSSKQSDPFKQFYRFSQAKSNAFNDAVDVLIDFLPERSSLSIIISQESVGKIGKQFEENVLGRQIFNFQFTANTLENLCFECCEAFNTSHQLNLNQIYSKIIENQKSRLQDEAYQHYLKRISSTFFAGGKIQLNQPNYFPINNFNLLQRHNQILQTIIEQTLKSASNCMDLNQYKNLYFSLRQKFNKMLSQLFAANQLKTEECCRQCYQLLQNIEECQISSETAEDVFRDMNNKIEQFTYGCSQTLGNDLSLLTYSKYLNRLKENIISNVGTRIVQALRNNEMKIQELKAEISQIKYDEQVFKKQLRELQYKYGLQSDILNQYKLKLTNQGQPKLQQNYSIQLNKSRKRNQELQQQVKDKNLFIEELQGIIERFEGLGQRDKQKYKFSKEIVEMIKEVSNQVNSCHVFIKEAKKINELNQDIKEGFMRQRNSIIEERKKAQYQINARESQFQKLIKEKTMLEEVVNEARKSIQVYKQVEQKYKEGISNLQNTYTQAQCLLAQTQNQLQLFKKAISLISEQQKGSRPQALNKFYKVSTNKDLKDLLKPFLKK